MLMIPTSVADVSCQAVSPWFSQLGLSVRADSIVVPHLCAGLGQDSAGRSAQNSASASPPVLRPPRTVHQPRACTPRTVVRRPTPPQTRAQTAAANLGANKALASDRS